MGLEEITNISVIGAGLMGHGIAQSFAQRNYTVMLYDLKETILKKALSTIRSNLETFVEVGLEKGENIEKILLNIHTTLNLQEAVKNAHFLIEAVPEDLILKMTLFEEIEKFCPETTILASNTSTLPGYEIGKRIKRKERFLITHWFNPPYIIPVVEIVPSEMTSLKVMEKTIALLSQIGKKPVKILKEIPGFLVNRIQTAMFREILSLLEQGVATPEDMDEAIKGSIGIRLAVIGPLQTMDMGGLDLIYKGMKNLYPLIDRSSDIQNLLKEKIERNELGIKTGKGFFQYPQQNHLPLKERDKKLLSLLTLFPIKE